LVQVTAATSVVISSGSTLGHVSAFDSWIYVYAVNNGGTVALAISTSPSWDEGVLQTTTAEGGAGAADSGTTLYSTAVLTSKAIRLVCRLRSNQTTAGTYAAVPTEVSLQFGRKKYLDECYVHTGNGHGSTSTRVRRFSTIVTETGSIDRLDSALQGTRFEITESGLYWLQYVDRIVAGSAYVGISLDSVQPVTTGITSIAVAERIAFTNAGTGLWAMVSTLIYLNSGSIVRPHDEGTNDDASAVTSFWARRIG
jgi:hypothetical protein